jgi:pyruvate kinase
MEHEPALQPRELLQQLNSLRTEMMDLEASDQRELAALDPDHRASATNLLHYVALRRHDIRQLQSQLAALGLSSLGRTGPHVISALHAVMNALHRIDGTDGNADGVYEGAPEIGEGATLLDKNTEALLGAPPKGRTVRIMVTMPSEAATDYELVRDLVQHGMDCMRINCAHDGPEQWASMIRNLRRAEKETNRPCKVAMDVAGPKLRTGPVAPGPAVLKFKPKRDDFGRVTSPARVWLTPSSSPEHAPAHADACLPVRENWLAKVKRGDRIRFTDARGAKRTLKVTAASENSRWAECNRTC